MTSPGSLLLSRDKKLLMTTILVLSVDKIGVTSWIALSNSSGKLMLRLSPSLFIANSE
jgi:hypothetical protein